MTQTASMVRVLATHAADFRDDEPLIAATGAELPKGDAILDPVRMATESKFPLSTKMTLALTPRRIVVYKNGWGNKVGALLGDVPQTRLTNITITWNRKLAIIAFALADAPPVAMRATEPDDAELLRQAFLEMRGRL